MAAQQLQFRMVRLVNRARRHWLAILFGAAFVLLGNRLGVWKSVSDLVNRPTGALEVADEKTKQEISRGLIETAWRRFYRTGVYLSRLRMNAPEDELAKLGKKDLGDRKIT